MLTTVFCCLTLSWIFFTVHCLLRNALWDTSNLWYGYWRMPWWQQLPLLCMEIFAFSVWGGGGGGGFRGGSFSWPSLLLELSSQVSGVFAFWVSGGASVEAHSHCYHCYHFFIKHQALTNSVSLGRLPAPFDFFVVLGVDHSKMTSGMR